MASLHNTIPSSSSIRFLGLIKQPGSEPTSKPFELDERDVVWSSSSDFSDTRSPSRSPPSLSNSPTNFRHHHHFSPSKSGLSAALSDDHHPLVRRKSNLNPSLSAASAAKAISPLRSENLGGVKFHQSAPVNVPMWPKKIGGFGNLGRFDEVDDEVDDEEDMVPPHEIVARSHVTFSVFEGVGRTLKGRDLRRVRNAVFQKTGFID
ncbi:unnamed protein product [Ilex paraguariensis]|uniref:Senescence regulator n=1 Tax=Ilex paraguariensis TaxID=185542 RepID=A0ABC8RSH6_9AQUA